MRMIYGKRNLKFDFYENEVQVLVIENPGTFSEIVWDLQRQLEGEDRQIILFDDEKLLPIKYIEIIIDPFRLEINNRKIIGKLYQELKEISNEDFYVEEGRLCTEIVNYLDDLSGKLPYSISFSTELEVSSLFKLYDLKLDVETESLLQKLIEYLQIMSSLCGIKLIVLVNIKHYLNNTQILELYKTAFYCKISLFLIEAAQKDILTGERVSILDSENCFIEL